MTKPNSKFSGKDGYHKFTGGHGQFEVFWRDPDEGEIGWYWWACFPGCMPDGEANGPFNSSSAAWNDARS